MAGCEVAKIEFERRASAATSAELPDPDPFPPLKSFLPTSPTFSKAATRRVAGVSEGS